MHTRPLMIRKLTTPLLLTLSLLIAVYGQRFVAGSENLTIGIALYLLAFILFGYSLLHWPDRAEADSRETWRPSEPTGARQFIVQNGTRRMVLIGLCLLLALFAYLNLADNRFSFTGTMSWTASLVLWVVAVGERPEWWEKLKTRVGDIRRNGVLQLTFKRHHGLFLIVLLSALFFRYFRLDSVPYELGSDHVEKLLDVNDVLSGLRPIFFPRNTGREAFQFYLTALLIDWTPLELGHMALKVGTTLVSMAAIPFTYLLGKELFDHRLGLLAAFFLSVSHWHVSISRIGLRFPFTATFATAALYFLIRAIRTGRRNDWQAAGTFLGIGLHTYIPMRIVPLLFVLLIMGKVAIDTYRSQVGGESRPRNSALTSDFWLGAINGGIMSFIWFIPLFRYMVDDPEMFWFRVTSRSISSQGAGQTSSLWPVFWTNLKDAALMFNVRGDVVYANTVPLLPFLGNITAAMFVLGLFYLAYRLIRFRDMRAPVLLLMLLVLVMPSVLSLAFPGENPSVVRTGGAIPQAMIIAALPLWLFWERFSRLKLSWAKRFAAMLIVWMCTAAFLFNYNHYFHRYDEQYRLSIWNSGEMGQVVKGFAASIGDLEQAYHIPYPHWVDTRAIAIHAGDLLFINNAVMDPPQTIVAHASLPGPKLYLLSLQDQASLELLQNVFPTGREITFESKIGQHKDFLIYFVPESAP